VGYWGKAIRTKAAPGIGKGRRAGKPYKKGKAQGKEKKTALHVEHRAGLDWCWNGSLFHIIKLNHALMRPKWHYYLTTDSHHRF
jgi:hypothetical protein